jgi:hypothetical protein
VSDRLPAPRNQHVEYRGGRRVPPPVPSEGQPQFVFVGMNKPGGQCRLHASRTFAKPPGWQWVEQFTGPALWRLDADLEKVLVVDAATWAEAMARVFEIWSNEDAEKQRLADLELRNNRDTKALE